MPSVVAISTAALVVAKLSSRLTATLPTQPDDARIVHAKFAELFNAGFAGDQRGGHRMLHAHLRLAAGRDVRPVGARGQERIACDRDLFHDRVRMRAPPVDDAIEHRMNDEAAWVRLECGLHDFPAVAEPVGENRKLRRLGKGVEVALAAG